MKLFILVVGITIIAIQAHQNSEERKRKEKYTEECKEESGVTDKVLTNALLGDFSDDPKLKQQFLCYGQKEGFIDEDGNINQNALKDATKQIVEDDQMADEIVQQCAKKEDDPKETAFNLYKCYRENAEIIL